ncbi:hypothetical protein PR048_022324 [Dryococelus australis]|uniref:RNA polymerase II subunit B1 CTD phosphatase RPAP2 homolog n=1 Tax=Dryococelus australis TaxID=614101 RepID=A0ABQ9H0R3_9NEOP|nr:hypothetical protein PR048_022324 [Dryococelus australis]
MTVKVCLFCCCQLQYICESHFQDVVEERALTKLCGYPLCQGQLPPAPSQQFRISTRLNKVYDITDRKVRPIMVVTNIARFTCMLWLQNFCSNRCYAAAKFLKQQLLMSPLWLRDKEEVPVFTLLPTAGPREGVGDELDFKVETVVADKTDLSCQDAVAECQDDLGSVPVECAVDTGSAEDHGSELGVKCAFEETDCGELRSSPWNSGSGSGVLNVSDVSSNSSEVNSAPCSAANSPRQEVEMKKSIAVDSMVSNNSAGALETGSSREPGYVGCEEIVKSGSLSGKCNVGCENLASECSGNFKNKNKDTVTGCDNLLESKQMMGQQAANKQCAAQEEDSGRKKGRNRKGGEEPGLRGIVLYIEKCVKEWFTADTLQLLLGEESRDFLGDSGVPLVDHHAQAALRRRIVLDRLNRVVPDLLAALGVVGCDISSDVRELVTTFYLSAHNITFHVPEWNLLGLILIHIMSLKNDQLQHQLRSKKVKDAQTMILLSFQQDSSYLDQLMCWLIDVDKTC